MSDLISRKKVLTILNRHTRSGGRDVDGDYVPPDITIGAKQEIKELPPEQPEPHWIPCSERLPDEAGGYLCTCIDARRLLVALIKWQPKMKSWNLSGARAYWKVIAWMPLPEPYQAESEE